MIGPYNPTVTKEDDGQAYITIRLPVKLHDEMMRWIVKTYGERNPNRSQFVRDAIASKLDKVHNRKPEAKE